VLSNKIYSLHHSWAIYFQLGRIELLPLYFLDKVTVREMQIPISLESQGERSASSDIVVELRCTNGTLYAPFGEVVRVPMFRELLSIGQRRTSIKQLVEDVGYVALSEAIQGPVPEILSEPQVMLATVDAPFTTKTWNLIHLALNGHATKPLCLPVAVRYELTPVVTKEMIEFFKLPTGKHREEQDASHGAITALLCARSNRQSEKANQSGARGLVRVNASVGGMKFGLDSLAASSAFKWSCAVPRSPDALAWPVLKFVLPVLPRGLRWKDDIFERLLVEAQVEIGGNVHYRVFARSNQILARMHGVWPERTNAYAELSTTQKYLRSQKPWQIAIPLVGPDIVGVLDKGCEGSPFHLAMARIRYQEVTITVLLQNATKQLVEGPSLLVEAGAKAIEPVDVSLDMDHIFVGIATRMSWSGFEPSSGDHAPQINTSHVTALFTVSQESGSLSTKTASNEEEAGCANEEEQKQQEPCPQTQSEDPAGPVEKAEGGAKEGEPETNCSTSTGNQEKESPDEFKPSPFPFSSIFKMMKDSLGSEDLTSMEVGVDDEGDVKIIVKGENISAEKDLVKARGPGQDGNDNNNNNNEQSCPKETPQPQEEQEATPEEQQSPSTRTSFASFTTMESTRKLRIAATTENYAEFDSKTFEIPNEGRISNPIAGIFTNALLLQFIPSAKLSKLLLGASDLCPVTNVILRVNKATLSDCDACDLTELNWLKVGCPQPARGALLLPFGYHPFDQNDHDSSICFGKIIEHEIEFVFDEQYDPSDWKVVVTSVGSNTTTFLSGMMGKMFVN